MTTYRPIGFRDLKAIQTISETCFDTPIEQFNYSFLFSLHQAHRLYGFVACQNETVIGYAVCDAVSGLDQAELLSIAVHPEHQKQGIGHGLVRQLTDQKHAPFSELSLEVRTTNTHAHRLYEHHGFRSVSRIKDYYGVGIDAFLFQRQL